MTDLTRRRCSLDGCGLPYKSNGYCGDHYYRWHYYGDPRARKRSEINADGCTIAGCVRPYFSSGFCEKHYVATVVSPVRRALRAETRRLNPTRSTAVTWQTRLEPKISRDGPMPRWRLDLGNCWLFTGALDKNGYGSLRETDRKTTGVHRLSYRMFVGEIPDGLHLDHLCGNGNIGCLRPTHLEPVTHSENSKRRMVCDRCSFFAVCPLCSHDLTGCGLVAAPSVGFGGYARHTGSFDDVFWSLTRPGPHSELMGSYCVDWMGSRDGNGYGGLRYNGRTVRAPRYAIGLGDRYKDDPRVPDHLCRRPCCVSPGHIAVVSLAENSRRRMVDCYRCAVLCECPSCGFRIEGLGSAVEAMAAVRMAA